MELTRASGANFFFPFFMIYFVFVLFYVLDVKWILMTSSAVITSYLIGIALRPEGFALHPEEVQNLIYLANLSGIAVVGSRILARLFFDEKRSRLELAKANEGLRELDHAKTSFFHNVSHEIRTPLTLILGPIDHLLQNRTSELSPLVAENLRGIRINALRLLKMVNTLLDFAKLEAGREKVSITGFKLDDLVDLVGPMFTQTAQEKGVALEIRAASKQASIWSDFEKVEKILVNLVSNALKFTPSGGRISVTSSFDGERFELRVQDTGVGIAPEHHERIFERFSQIDNQAQASTRGTGIGLAMVRDYVRLLGGEIRLESELGRGATFVVHLPVRSLAPEGSEDSGTYSTKRSLDMELAGADIIAVSKKTTVDLIERAGPTRPWVMVVDDNESLVGLLRSILEDEYRLVLAADGQIALQYLARHEVDLIVSDVMMPGISGLELCQRIKADERLRHIPVVLLTARGGTSSKVEGFEHGADDYLGKPFDPAELKARVRALFKLRKLTSDLAHRGRELQEAMNKLVEEELKLIESEKLRTLGEIAAGMAHELHNYLNMVYNGAIPLRAGIEELRRRFGDQIEQSQLDEMVELTEVVAEAARTAASVTGELKRYAHHGKQAAAVERFDLHALLQSTVRLFGLAGPKLNVVFDFCSEPLGIHCPPGRLTQVFTNLIKNGFEAAGNDGVVTIRTSLDGNVAVVQIEDNGPGIPREHQGQLFVPFQTSKKQGEGLGLGLALSKKVLEEIGADLSYDESYTGGARFVVRIPIDSGHTDSLSVQEPGSTRPAPRSSLSSAGSP
jgi:signal transduction histidine kinase